MKKSLLYSAISIVVLFLAWGVAYLSIANEYILPAPWTAFSSLFSLLGKKSFYVAFSGTFFRATRAFIYSFVLGAVCATIAYLLPVVRGALAPVLSLVRTIPTMAFILLLLLWTSPLVAPVVVGVTVLFPVCYGTALSALDGVGKEYAEVAKAFSVPLNKRIFQMYLPLAAPAVLSQAGGTFSMGLKVVVSAEVLSFTAKSLGGLMQEAKIYVEMNELFALTIVAILAGFLIEGVCTLVSYAIERRKK